MLTSTKKNMIDTPVKHVSPSFIQGTRLGNLMFSIAAVYAHAQRVAVDCHVPWDFSDDSRKLRDFLTSPFPVTEGGVNEAITYKEPAFSYHPIPRDIVEGGMHGYFQSARYFDDFKESIFSLFKPFIAPKVQGSAGVNIRLGDYRANEFKHYICKADFLETAISRISPHIKHLVILSDEPDSAASMVRDLKSAQRFELEVDHSSPYDALRRLTSMEELIISASSFSWWGAYLGQQEKVFVPAHWFNGVISDYQDVYLPHWVRL